jgi:6-phosphogluconolactonase
VEETVSNAAPVVVEDVRELAATLADSFAVAARQAIDARGVFRVALAGGLTPKAAYALLAAPPYREIVEWPHVRFFFGDERCVPPDHPDANYYTIHKILFAALEIPDAQIFRMRGEDEPIAAAAAYAAVLQRELGASPIFDLLLLGMGTDGHTASLFPGTEPDDGTPALVQARTAPLGMPVTQRLTITPRVVNAARKIIIAVAGAEKSATLACVLKEPYDALRYPIEIVRHAQGKVTWLVDEAASCLLPALRHPPRTV